jgi:hypothetical protein
MEEQKPLLIPNSYKNGYDREVWSIFKIMGELVDGYDTLFRIPVLVSLVPLGPLLMIHIMKRHLNVPSY